MTKHTPGPWTAQQDCRSEKNDGIFDGNNPDPYGNQNAWGIYGPSFRIAVLHEEGAYPQETINANARLIAAAPALLDALTDLLASIHKARTVRAPAGHYDEDVYYNGIDFAPQMDLAEEILRTIKEGE